MASPQCSVVSCVLLICAPFEIYAAELLIGESAVGLWSAAVGISALLAAVVFSGHRKLARERALREGAEAQLELTRQSLETQVAERAGALRVSEERLREAQRIAKIGSWELDLTTNELVWSDEIYRIFEIDPEHFQASYEAFLDAIHPEDRELVNSAYQESVKSRDSYEIEHRLLMPDGRIKHVQEIGRTEYSENGEPLKSSGTVQDISRRWQAEASSRQAAAVYEATAQGVMVTDLNGVVQDVNPAFCEITGFREADIVGKNASVLRSGRHDEAFFQSMWTSLSATGVWRGQIWNRRQDDTVFPELLTINAVRDEQGRSIGYVGIFTDISAIKEAEAQLKFLAHHDPLTELPNRVLLNARLDHSIRQAERNKSLLGVVFIDLDQFKDVNDSLGHSAGDQLLKELSARLVDGVRANDTVARLAGDEFVVLLEAVDSAEHVGMTADKLMTAIARPFTLTGACVSVTASAGISLYPTDGTDSSALLSNADAAMYHAKEEGRNTYRFYSSKLTERAFEQIFIRNEMRSALKNSEFWLAYQPKVDLSTGKLDGLEALIRWSHPRQGEISPARFIPIAESGGLIREIGAWVLRAACKQGRAWLDQGLQFGRIAVNVAGPQIQHRNFVSEVVAALNESGLPPECLELEVTEGFVMQRPDDNIGCLRRLRQLGIQISIDDFGTGYSSLSYLKRLPIDRLKIDQSFVRGIPEDKDDIAICETVIAMARALRLSVIAEGVESEAHVAFLKEKGCDEAQGFYFSQPLPADHLGAWLNSQVLATGSSMHH